MKKIIFILLMSAVLCFTSACGNNETAETTDKAAQIEETTDTESEVEKVGQENAAEEKSGYVCVLDNGISIEMGAIMEDVPAVFGDPVSYAEAPSCIHEGTDKVYTYNGYTLTTSPDADGKNRIYEVSLLSDAVALDGGVTIGSSMDTVVSVFGEGYTEQFGVLQYTLDGVNVSVVLDGDAYVISLVITADME